MYAVVDMKGHQFIVREGDKIIVDNVGEEEGKKIDFDTVLACFDSEGENVKVGKPYLEGASIKAKVEENKRGKKINGARFHNKNRYYKRYGFRPYNSVLKIEKMNI